MYRGHVLIKVLFIFQLKACKKLVGVYLKLVGVYLDIHLQVGVHEIYTPPIEQSDWSEFTTMVQVLLMS